jgi:hypothetical protein
MILVIIDCVLRIVRAVFKKSLSLFTLCQHEGAYMEKKGRWDVRTTYEPVTRDFAFIADHVKIHTKGCVLFVNGIQRAHIPVRQILTTQEFTENAEYHVYPIGETWVQREPVRDRYRIPMFINCLDFTPKKFGIQAYQNFIIDPQPASVVAHGDGGDTGGGVENVNIFLANVQFNNIQAGLAWDTVANSDVGDYRGTEKSGLSFKGRIDIAPSAVPLVSFYFEIYDANGVAVDDADLDISVPTNRDFNFVIYFPVNIWQNMDRKFGFVRLLSYGVKSELGAGPNWFPANYTMYSAIDAWHAVLFNDQQQALTNF